jgi:hypothetical protein
VSDVAFYDIANPPVSGFRAENIAIEFLEIHSMSWAGVDALLAVCAFVRID